jgi:hypothetical protein
VTGIQVVAAEVADRLRRRGVALDGHETDEGLVSLLDAVEYSSARSSASAVDLMVDEPDHGRVVQPDDEACALPKRRLNEGIAPYIACVRKPEAALADRHVAG